MQLSSVDLRYLVREAQFLVGARVNKIFHPRKTELHIIVHVPSKGRVVLTVFLPSLIFIGSEKESTERPSGFCMGLSKRLNNARLRSIEQIGFDRVVKIDFEKEEPFTLYIELFRKGNVILVKDGMAVSAMVRDGVMLGQPYEVPKGAKDPELFTADELAELWNDKAARGDKTLVKWIATKLGMGKIYAEYLCDDAGFDKDAMEFSDFAKLQKALVSLLNQPIDACIVGEKAFPFPVKEGDKLPSFLEAIASVVTPQIIERKQTDATSTQTTKLQKHEKMVSAQKKRIIQLEEKAVEATKVGELIYENYQPLNALLEKIAKLKGAALEEFLKDHPNIDSYDLKNHTIKLKK